MAQSYGVFLVLPNIRLINDSKIVRRRSKYLANSDSTQLAKGCAGSQGEDYIGVKALMVAHG